MRILPTPPPPLPPRKRASLIEGAARGVGEGGLLSYLFFNINGRWIYSILVKVIDEYIWVNGKGGESKNKDGAQTWTLYLNTDQDFYHLITNKKNLKFLEYNLQL